MRLCWSLAVFTAAAPLAAQSRDCDGYYTPLMPPAGWCTRLFADGIGPVRQVIIHPDGQIVAALNRWPGLVRMRDSAGHGRQIVTFGPGQGGSGVTWRNGWLYFAADSAVVRYRWPADSQSPSATPEWIARDLPVGDYGTAHTMKGIAVGGDGSVYVSIGSATDNCQLHDRAVRSPGRYPCDELVARAGIWRFTPPATAGGAWEMQRYATGLRNAEAMAVDPTTDHLWAATQGRDDLNRTWGWPDTLSANQPAEMLEQILPNGDYGWPYCQGNWSHSTTTLIRAPEYAGSTGPDCALATPPVMGFPAHWAPMAVAVVNSTIAAVPHPGLYIAFHGSRLRAPLPETGHFLVFVPLDENGRPQGDYRLILHTAGPIGSLRPAGVAVGLDGMVYVTDDEHGRIYRLEPHEPPSR